MLVTNSIVNIYYFVRTAVNVSSVSGNILPHVSTILHFARSINRLRLRLNLSDLGIHSLQYAANTRF